MTKIVKLRRTCFMAPEQWEGELETGESLYARERHGEWRVEVDDQVVGRGWEGSALDALYRMFDLPDEAFVEDEEGESDG